jgi:hypothetical protein
MRNRGSFVMTVVGALLLSVTAFAQTTGTIEGTIVDEKNQSLPGVTVEASSASLQGTKVAASDANGNFRLVFLPPGSYMVHFSLHGFAAQEQTGINVGLGRTVTLHVTMHSAFKEEVVVSGAAPIIDTTSTEVGTNVDAKDFTNLPMQRNFASVILIAPGTAQDAVGVTVYGSTGAENGYFIDGINTTGVGWGLQGKVLNFEFIQEAQVKTGGYEAEYGRATGGLINVITKSGGNAYHGDVFGYYEGKSTQDNLSDSTIKDAFQGGVSSLISNHKNSDYGFDLGGYVIKDKLWFFGAYNYVKTDEDNKAFRDFTEFGGTNYGFPTPGTIYVGETKRNLWSGKLTWRVNQNHSVILSAFGDPSTFEGPAPGITLAAQPSVFLRTIDSGATDGTLKYEGVLGQNWVVNAQAAQHKDKTLTGGPGLSQIGFFDYTHPLYDDAGIVPLAGGYGYAQRARFGRDIYRGDLAYFLSNFGGDHEFKGGVEYEHVTIDNATYNSGGQRIYQFAGTSPVDGQRYVYYRHRFYVNTTDINPNDVTAANIVNPLTVSTKTNNEAAYLQDTWRVTPNLTFNLGIRWESQKLYNALHEVALELKDNWAPRLGFIWDPRGNGKSKIYGSWGKFYETIPMDMVIRSFGNEFLVFSYNMNGALDDPNRTNVTCDPAFIALGIRSRCTLTGGDTPVDPNLKGEYIQEYIIGGEVEVAPDFVVGAKYINRSLGRVIEDMLSGSIYQIANPGEGLGKTTYDFNTGEIAFAVPKAKREYKGIELSARKRFSNNWSVIASYLWSKLEGNYDGTFQASTGQLDPNINSAFDYGEFQVNNTGYLSADRRHQVRVDATYVFPFGLTVGGSAYWRSGLPITAYGYTFAYQNWELYLSDRGAFGRTDDEYEADLHLGYPLKLGGVQVNLLMDVFNVLNRQGETNRNMRYDLIEDYEVIDYDTGQPLPPIKPGDTTRPPTNVAFNHANAWQAPRSIRFGVRLTF